MFTGLRKFYDVATPEAAPAAPAVTPPEGMSIAAIAAKNGTLVQPGEDGREPYTNKTEKKEEPKPAPATPAPATDAKPAEKVKPESFTPTADPKKEISQTATPEKVPTWQEVLKNQQPDAILKELGYGDNLVGFLKGRKELDPKMVGFFNHWETNDGNVEPYLRALGTDFTKMKPEDVMRYQLQVQNPELDAKQLDRLYKLKVIDRYKLDPQNYSEDEVMDGQIELMADIKPIRQQLAEQQQKLLFDKPAPKQPEVDPEAEAEKQRVETYRNYISEHPLLKALTTNKAWSEGEGEDKFDYPVDAQSVIDVLLDDKKWAQSLQSEDGQGADADKLLLLGMIAQYGRKFLNDYAQHFRKIGGRAAIAPIENAKPPGTLTTPAPAEKSGSPAAEAAKRGRYVPGNR